MKEHTLSIKSETSERNPYEDLISEARSLLSSSLDLDQTLINVAHLIVPRLADWCIIDLGPGDGTYRRLVVAHEGKDRDDLARRLFEEMPSHELGGEWERRLLAGETLLIFEPKDFEPNAAATDGFNQAISDLHPNAVLSVPMVTRHGVVGVLTAAMAESSRAFDNQAESSLQAIAERCALAIENATFYGNAQEANRERSDSLELLRAIFSGSGVGLAFLDPYQHVKFANDELARIAGVGADKVANASLRVLLPEIAERLSPVIKTIAEGNKDHRQVEAEIADPSRPGETITCLATCHPARNADDVLVGIGLVVIDITARRDAEAARHQSEEQLHLALEAARMGSWQWDLSTDTTVWSEMAAKLIGLEGSLETTADELEALLCPNQIEILKEANQHALETGEYETEFQVRWPNGQDRTLLSKGRAVSMNGVVTGLTGILLDVTEQKALADEGTRLAQRQARAGEQAVRMQRVTSKLSDANSVEQICQVLLSEGSSITQASRSMIHLINERGDKLDRSQTIGFTEPIPRSWTQLDLSATLPVPDAVRNMAPVLASSGAKLIEQFPDTEETFADIQGFAVFPLTVNGRAIGAWSMFWDDVRHFEEGELIIFLTLASQCAQSIERARLYERERFIATALQRTLLPAQLPNLRGATTARRYLPTASGVEVGGDWYDVLQLPRERVALVIGDVGGHNIDAAAVMGQIRNAIRSYAWEGHPAAKVMEATNRLITGLEPGVLATCCYVELSLDDGIAAVALAGHPPPLVIEVDGSSAFMEMEADPPLGAAPDHLFEQSSLFLTPGQSLALYTDGLIETRTVSLTEGMDRLAHAASTATDSSAEALADAIIAAASQNDVEDDMALLVLRYAPASKLPVEGESRSVRRALPSSAASAGVARRFAADVMEDWGASELSDTVALCVSELVTNALIHTATEIELVLHMNPEAVRVDVIDQSDRMPSMRAGGEEATTGRGLHIVEAVSSDWGVEAAGSGKAVWFRLDRGEQSHRIKRPTSSA